MWNFLKRLLGGANPEPRPTDGAEDSELTLPFEFVVVRGTDAMRERANLLSRSNITPVIMGGREDVRLLEDLLEDSAHTAEAIIARANDLDVEAWLRSRVAEDPGQYEIDPAEWPSERLPPMELSVHLDVLSRKPKDEVIIGLAPTPHSWEAPAFVTYGDWNDCPSADVHVAMHKRWHQRFGSEIACMSSDIIECTVADPPASREAALALAREQFLYCSDIVHQGVGTVEALAATLLKSKVWYFWWD